MAGSSIKSPGPERPQSYLKSLEYAPNRAVSCRGPLISRILPISFLHHRINAILKAPSLLLQILHLHLPDLRPASNNMSQNPSFDAWCGPAQVLYAHRSRNFFMNSGLRHVTYMKTPEEARTRATSSTYALMLLMTSSGGSYSEPWRNASRVHYSTALAYSIGQIRDSQIELLDGYTRLKKGIRRFKAACSIDPYSPVYTKEKLHAPYLKQHLYHHRQCLSSLGRLVPAT